MNKLAEYFSTDWAAMTGQDWVGLIWTIITFVLITWAWIRYLNPKNREENEQHKFMLFDEESDGENHESARQ
ncbi:cbb3-type cytochrome c oxidase subunit 3 [Pelagibaculum spongiae]|uniref:CcoQ/FixQ family Cbb3-type cytochrome c oxidase assembly chaperone n=1 Tax=Pelagibaculum spongiae TaxID=2080658 RepID=A0A2V1H3U9_9GAMM|nr:cbb3-type cytochrome c oxidase subunit 3 [Pelagibaculum spongiae]PVZ70316.1 CcoQ/FixQ family Cbb3-type cytochrome c oxidase assembly chaperone [Pelagibaculum spongiae]